MRKTRSKDRRKWIAALLALLMLATLIAPLAAHGQEMTTPQATVAVSETGSVPDYSIDDIITLIDMIDTEQPDAQEVELAREAYNKLSFAQRAQITNIAKLVAAEEKLRVPNTEKESGKRGLGKQFSLLLTDYLPKASLRITYVSDDLNTEKEYTPQTITLFAPDGSTSFLTPHALVTELTTKHGTIFVQEADDGLRLDFNEVTKGIWTVKADVELDFMLTEYKTGPIENAADSSQETSTDIPETKPGEEKQTKGLNPIIALVLACVGIAGVFVLAKVLTKPKTKDKPKKPEDEPVKIKEPETHNRDIELSVSEQRKREAVAAVSESWKSEGALGDKKGYQETPEDERFVMSQEDLINDGSIEELGEDFIESLFGKKRFD